MAPIGFESSEAHGPSVGRGIGPSNQGGIGQQQNSQQQQTGLDQQSGASAMYQQVQAMSQANMSLLSKGGSGGRGAAENGSEEAGKQAQESIKEATEKQGEELKKAGESFFSGIGSAQPKDEGVKKEVAEAFKSLSTPGSTSGLSELTKGVVQDIQQLNAIQVNTLAKIAEAFTAPPRSNEIKRPQTSVQNQVAAAGLTPQTNPGNIFAQALNQQSPVQVPQHSTQQRLGVMESENRGVMRGISSDTIYNVPMGVTLPQ
jgi:hypothetical protein